MLLDKGNQLNFRISDIRIPQVNFSLSNLEFPHKIWDLHSQSKHRIPFKVGNCCGVSHSSDECDRLRGYSNSGRGVNQW